MEMSNKTAREEESVGGSFILFLGRQCGGSSNDLTLQRLRALGSWSL